MKMILILCAMATMMMAACAMDSPVQTSTSGQDLICDPNCDPGNFQYLVSAVVGAGGGLGTRVAGTMQCYHYNGGYDPVSDSWQTEHDECDEIRQDPWGQQYDVWCSSLGSCHHRACGDTDPNQLPCQ